MKLKLFANLVFMFVGTAILIACSVVVMFNFIRDSRVFADEVPVVASNEQPKENKPEVKEEDDDIIIEETQEYTRRPDPAPSTSPKPSPEPSGTPEPEQEPEDLPMPETSPTMSPEEMITVRVEVINYSGIPKIAEMVRETLELHGYKVSAGNAKSNTPIFTQIIERNDYGVGTDLSLILKIPNVIKIPDPESRFAATIIIGDDYKP